MPNEMPGRIENIDELLDRWHFDRILCVVGLIVFWVLVSRFGWLTAAVVGGGIIAGKTKVFRPLVRNTINAVIRGMAGTG